MKDSVLLIILIWLIFFSCQSQVKTKNMKDERIKIQLDELSNEHPNKKQVQWFLNNYQEEFIENKEDWEILKYDNLIQNGYNFYTKLSNVSLSLIFCENQQDALTVGEANFSSNNDNQDYGVNGAVLFVVKGKDKYEEVNSVLSWFSGEE